MENINSIGMLLKPENIQEGQINIPITKTEKELLDSNLLSNSNVKEIVVKHAYCENCGKELKTNTPAMFNPYTKEKHCIHVCECDKIFDLEYAYPRLVFIDEKNNEIFAHCE